MWAIILLILQTIGGIVVVLFSGLAVVGLVGMCRGQKVYKGWLRKKLHQVEEGFVPDAPALPETETKGNHTGKTAKARILSVAVSGGCPIHSQNAGQVGESKDSGISSNRIFVTRLSQKKEPSVGKSRIIHGFKAKILKPKDEIWWFSSNPLSWEQLHGRAGYALVRNGKIIRSHLVYMN
jgi:hypothetical protein